MTELVTEVTKVTSLQESHGYMVTLLNRQSYIVTGLKELDPYMVKVWPRCNDVTFLTL